jgi:hypothetical protein
LVIRGREGQWRPCKLEGAPLKGAMDWIGQYKQHWEERLDRLDAYLLELHAKEQKHGLET